MVKLYPALGGYGWKMDEIIGAQVVSVPMALPISMADKAWHDLMLWIGGAFAAIAVVGNGAAILISRS
jgi:protein-histidine pros-kinase